MIDMNVNSDNATNDMNNVTWSVIPILPPSIQISTQGELREFITPTEIVPLKQTKTADGCMHINHKGKSYAVHRLVALTFIPNPDPDNLTIVNHTNGCKSDNRVENLQWVSPLDNMIKSCCRGLDRRAKLYCEQTGEIFGTLRAASAYFRIPQDLLARAVKEQKPIAGLTLRYLDRDDSLLNGHEVLYLDFDSMFQLACESSNPQEMEQAIQRAMHQDFYI